MDKKPSSTPGPVWFLVTAVALAVGVIALARPALAAEAVRIDSIDPSCAAVGDKVKITGIGFGGPNVKITVGGVPAKVLTATGDKATFRVPQGVPPGSTTVTATNPGGHTGSIGFQVKGREVCDGSDNDCDGSTDEGFDVGAACTVGVGACERSGVKVCTADGRGTVCNATPGTPTAEVCNDIDDNCNGEVDEGVKLTFFRDADGDGFGNPSTSTQACTVPAGFVANSQDCNDSALAIHPGAAERCNSVDDNCNGSTDEGFDVGAACTVGVGACERSGVKVCTADGSGTVCNATPGTPTAEVCNGVDDNCDGQVDEGVLRTFFRDADGDGFGNPAASTQACTAPTGFVANDQDCNDSAPAIHPGAAEICGNGIDEDCDGADTVCSPGQVSVTITEPAADAVLGASPIVVRGTVSDPHARVIVQSVIATVSGTTFEAKGITLFEGPNELSARARNDEGGQATATRSVILDTIPPSLTITSPAERSISTTTTVPIVGTVSDATAVTCLVNGTPATVNGGTFNGTATLVAGENEVAVACQDAAGNVSRRALTLFFDTELLTVTGVEPGDGAANVAPTTAITVTFSEPVDPASVSPATFFIRVDAGILAANATVSQDRHQATLTPATLLPSGVTIDATVTTGVTDAAGNPLRTMFTSQFATAGEVVEPGVAVGEVYDDTRSLPLEGATVEAFTLDTRALLASTETDERGRYLLTPGRSEFLIRVTKPKFTAVEREITMSQGSFADVLDARLTPLAKPQAVTAVLGADVKDAAGDVLTIPPGAFDADAPVTFTAVSEQGPHSAFPLGWAPLGIVEIAAPAAFDPPATLAMVDRSGAAAGKEAVFARYDEQSASWLALATVSVPASGPIQLADVTGSSQIALLLPDSGDGAPPPPVPDEPLAAGAAVSIPQSAAASGVVIPPVGRADDPTPAHAIVTVAAETPLRSGTPLRGDFMELFLLRDGGRVVPLDTSQDLFAYRSLTDATGRSVTAHFPIAPSRVFGAGELSEGTITVKLLRSAMIGGSLIGSSGGGVQIADGSRVIVPVGALPGDVPVNLRRLDAATFPVPAPPGFIFLGGLQLDLFGVTAAGPLALTLGGAAALVPTGSQVVVAEARTVLGRERLVFVALARVDGDGLTTVTEVDGVTLPGVHTGGRYGFYHFDGELKIVAGTARDESGRRDGHVIELEGLPFVSITNTAGSFALVSPPGPFTLLATGAVIHDQVRIKGDTGTPFLAIVIGAIPPRVELLTVRLPKLEGNFAGPVVLLGKPAPVIDDDANGQSTGNGNGRIEAGERVELTLTVRNDGTVAVTGGFLALSIRDPDGPVAVTPATIPVETLEPDKPMAVGPFVFTAPSGVDPARLRYTLSYLTTGGLSNAIPFELPLGVDHLNVPVGSEVIVRFSEPVVVNGGLTLARENGATPVPVDTKLLLSEDGTVATLRPLAPLAQETLYRVTLTAAIVDADRRSLAEAPVIERFKTEDLTPPAPIDPGRIEASVPDDNGFVTITGSPGSVNPDDTVIVLNETTGLTVLATVRADGSFVARIRAEVTDQISFIVRDRNGNEIKIGVGPFVRRDPVTGDVVSVVIGRDGGSFTSPQGIRLIVPAGALAGATELSVSRTEEPFELPPDIAADPNLVAAFQSRFAVVDRVQIDADVDRFAGPVRLALPPPAGAKVGDLFLVVRTRMVTIGGPLADLDAITGLTAAQNPVRTVERLEIIDSATVKNEDGKLVLSTDSPPFPGITEPGVVTVLKVMAPLTFFTGEARRDTTSGPPVAGAVVQSLPDAGGTFSFAAVTDSSGRFIVADAAVGGPFASGTTIASRLDVTDPAFRRMIRRNVRGTVGSPAQLAEPFVLPAVLPPAFIDVLGDIEPPTVEIRIEGPSFANGLSRVGDPLKVTVVAKDNDRVEFVALEVNQGSGFEAVSLAADGTFTLTPSVEAVIAFHAQVRDPSGNMALGEELVRTVTAAPGAPLVPGPLPGPPAPLGTEEEEVSFDGDITVHFSEPLDPSTVNKDTVKVKDPEGNPIDIDVTVEGGGTAVRATPKRNLRLGACYMVELSSSIKDLSGESFPGKTLEFQTPQPVQVATIPLPNAEDVALMGDVLVTINHPNGVSAGDVGALHTFRVRDEAGRLLTAPLLLASKQVNGRPLSLAVDGTSVFVANRFLGPVAIKQPVFTSFIPGVTTSIPDIVLGCSPLAPIPFAPDICLGLSSIWETFPQPPSNLEVFDLSEPANPVRLGATVINSIPRLDLWEPNTWPDRVKVTEQGIAVFNFINNLEFFTVEGPQIQSRGVLGRIRRYGEVTTGSEFLDAAFFDGFAVVLEEGGMRIVSTEGVGDRFEQERVPTLSFFSMTGTSGGRVGAVPAFEWVDSSGNRRTTDLAFIAGRDKRLTIFDVTNPSAPAPLSVLSGPLGNMSFEACRGLAYLYGSNGEFHVVDFNDPTVPIELNAPGAGKVPFRVEGLGSSFVFKENTNQDGVVYIAGDAGVAVVQTRGCSALGSGCRDSRALSLSTHTANTEVCNLATGTCESGCSRNRAKSTTRQECQECPAANQVVMYKPGRQLVNSPDWNLNGQFDWTMWVEVTDDDGVVLHDVTLEGRLMAKKISIPYYFLQTSKVGKSRCQLKPNSDGTACEESFGRSRLVHLRIPTDVPPIDAEKLVIEATYRLDKIPDQQSKSCLLVTQRYEFFREIDPREPGNTDQGCEPTETTILGKLPVIEGLPCARFKPIVEYKFFSEDREEKLVSMNVAQRLHFMVDGLPANTAGVFHDCETFESGTNLEPCRRSPDLRRFGLSDLEIWKAPPLPPFFPIPIFSPLVGLVGAKPGDLFSLAGVQRRGDENPLEKEVYDLAVIKGNPTRWDNFHQTWRGFVLEPILPPGCPECVHIHWRWFKCDLATQDKCLDGPSINFGKGKSLIPLGSKQSVDFAIVKDQEEDPANFRELANGESLKGALGLVFWQSGTSDGVRDRFFTYGGGFSSLPGDFAKFKPKAAQ